MRKNNVQKKVLDYIMNVSVYRKWQSLAKHVSRWASITTLRTSYGTDADNIKRLQENINVTEGETVTFENMNQT